MFATRTQFAVVARRWAFAVVLACGVLVAGLGSVAEAKSVSNRVQSACGGDYSRFCSAYAVGTTKLRQCMRSNGRRLSKRCVNALVDAGTISRRSLRRSRRRGRRGRRRRR